MFHSNVLSYRYDTQMSRQVFSSKRLSDASELRLANVSFALNNCTVMKLSSKGSCVAILRSPALSLELQNFPHWRTQFFKQQASSLPEGSARMQVRCLWTERSCTPQERKVAPCLVDMSSEQLQFGCSVETVVSTSALWGDCCAVRGNGRHRLWKQRLNLAGRSTPAQLLDPVQYPLHVTHFGHTQVLKDNRKAYLWRKGGKTPGHQAVATN